MSSRHGPVLVTGGVRSGKSSHAEHLLAAEPSVVYVAPGPSSDDLDWQDRVARHRDRRPMHWRTCETTDVAGVLRQEPGAVLVDCLGTWLTGLLDAEAAWEQDPGTLQALVETRIDLLVVAAAARRAPTVLVTNEVGWGVVPGHRSGRIFRDLLGAVNQRVAQICDEMHLVVAGRVLVL